MLALTAGVGRGQEPSPQAPAISYAASDLAVANCGPMLEAVARGNSVIVNAISALRVTAHNDQVWVVATCVPKADTPVKRVMLLASSTDAGIALWYRDEMRAKVRQLALHAVVTGTGTTRPAGGSAVALAFNNFSRPDLGEWQADSLVENGLKAEGYKFDPKSRVEWQGAAQLVMAVVEAVPAVGGYHFLVIAVAAEEARADACQKRLQLQTERGSAPVPI